jgi:lysozyme
MFVSSLEEHERGMRDCLTAPDALPDKVYVSFLSLTYNIGIRGFCRSTLARYANDNQLVAACNELPKFNRAGGKEVRGLTLRRAQERKLCLEGARAA